MQPLSLSFALHRTQNEWYLLSMLLEVMCFVFDMQWSIAIKLHCITKIRCKSSIL